jgi:hypothetical protein
VAEMISTTVSFPKWSLTTQADIDQCKNELFDDHHIASNAILGWDEHDAEVRLLQIHSSDPNDPYMASAALGQIVILFNGKAEALTAEEYTARGFGE